MSITRLGLLLVLLVGCDAMPPAEVVDAIPAPADAAGGMPSGTYTAAYDYAPGCYPDSGPARLLPRTVVLAADGTFDSDPAITWSLTKSGDVWGGTATAEGCTWIAVLEVMPCTLPPMMRPAACN